MVAAVRRSANHGGFRNTQFDVAFADALFVPSPVDAVREMLRVLKAGRKLALAVWHLPESNPFFYTLSQVIARYVDSAPLAPDAPDAFRFAGSGRLREVLDEAGTHSARGGVIAHNFESLALRFSQLLRGKHREVFAKLLEISIRSGQKSSTEIGASMVKASRRSEEAVRHPSEMVFGRGGAWRGEFTAGETHHMRSQRPR